MEKTPQGLRNRNGERTPSKAGGKAGIQNTDACKQHFSVSNPEFDATLRRLSADTDASLFATLRGLSATKMQLHFDANLLPATHIGSTEWCTKMLFSWAFGNLSPLLERCGYPFGHHNPDMDMLMTEIPVDQMRCAGYEQAFVVQRVAQVEATEGDAGFKLTFRSGLWSQVFGKEGARLKQLHVTNTVGLARTAAAASTDPPSSSESGLSVSADHAEARCIQAVQRKMWNGSVVPPTKRLGFWFDEVLKF
jgi:hypothetical protein